MSEQPLSPAYFMRTARIGFRCWTTEDLPLALGLWNNPQVTRLIADLGESSEQQARERLAREIVNQDRFGAQYWPIFHLESGVHLGCCGLRPYRPEERIFEIGAHLLPAYWSQKYATEALEAVLGYAFVTLKMAALFARHNPQNHGSRRIVEKLGFHHTHDDLMPQTGLLHPAYLMHARDYFKTPGYFAENHGCP